MAKPACPSHPWVVRPTENGPDCCALKSQAGRPRIYLLASGELTLDSTPAVAGGPGQAALPPFAKSGSNSPPFVKPVFAKKTDLRI